MTTATDIKAALAKRFPAPEWATFYEVRNDAGFSSSRSADVVTMNTWPSRGLAVHGIEIKVSRGDWLRERADPSKSAPIQKFCDRWWLAVSDDKIVQDGELPETWGLLILNGKGLKQAKEAPRLEPEDLDRGFVAMLLRNATKGLVAAASVDELVQQRLDSAVKSHWDNVKWQAERDAKALKDLRETVDAFEKASGIKLSDQYVYGPMRDPSKLGAAVRYLLNDLGDSRLGSVNSIQAAQNQLSAVVRDLAAAAEAFDALRPDLGLSEESGG